MTSRANPMGLGGAGARQSRGGQSMPPIAGSHRHAPASVHNSSRPPSANAAPRAASHQASRPSGPASHHPPGLASHRPSQTASHHPSRPNSQHPSRPASQHPSRPASQHPSRPASNNSSRPNAQHPSRPASHHPSRNLAPPVSSHGMLPPRSSRAPASSHHPSRAPQASYHSSRQQHAPVDFGPSGPPPIPYDQRPSQIALANGQSRGPRPASSAGAFAPGDYTKVGQGVRSSQQQIRPSQVHQSQRGPSHGVRASQHQSQGPRSAQYQQSQAQPQYAFDPAGVASYNGGGLTVDAVEDFVLRYPEGPIPGRMMPDPRGVDPHAQVPLVGGQFGAALVRRMWNHPNELVWQAFAMMFQQQGGVEA